MSLEGEALSQDAHLDNIGFDKDHVKFMICFRDFDDCSY